jgi:hypothetical protein
MRILTAILISTALIVPSVAQPRRSSNNDKIRQVFAGNTISGTEGGKAYVEFFHHNGRISGEASDGKYSGNWQVSHGRVCLSYEKGNGRRTPWDCSNISVNGSRIVWIAEGKKFFSALARGNPRGL